TGYSDTGVAPNVVCTDTCTIKNGGCDPNAGCSHDNTTNAVECTCKTGYTNTGVAPNVVCTGTIKTHAPSRKEAVIQMPVAHTTTQPMRLNAHAKLVTPTLE
ncbi:unnamed protein product, partial [Rotaria magnacalcarata]